MVAGFASAIGAVAPLLNNIFGGSSVSGANNELMQQSFNYNYALMNRQFELQKQLAEYTGLHAHSWEVQDLINAGLNPVLSANNGNTYSTGSFGFGQASGTVNSAMAEAQIKNMTNEQLNITAQTASNVALQNSQAKLNNAQANTAITQAHLNSAATNATNLNSIHTAIENSYLPQRQKAELDNIVSQTQYNNIKGNCETFNATTNRINAQTQREQMLIDKSYKNQLRRESIATEHYQRTRSRGYSDSLSKSLSVGVGGVKTDNSYSHTY